MPRDRPLPTPARRRGSVQPRWWAGGLLPSCPVDPPVALRVDRAARSDRQRLLEPGDLDQHAEHPGDAAVEAVVRQLTDFLNEGGNDHPFIRPGPPLA